MAKKASSKKYCITKYMVKSCHYGRGGESSTDDNARFSRVIDRFSAWASSAENIGRTALLDKRIFIKECHSDGNGNYAFVLWLATSEDSISCALKLAAKPGEKDQIDMQKHGDGFIPGCPLYFFINTSEPFVYTIRPSFAVLNGKTEFEQALRDYMGWYDEGTQMPLIKEDGTAFVQMQQPYNHPVLTLQVGFSVAEKDLLVGHADEIYKLVHVVYPSEPTKRSITRFVNSMSKHLNLDVEHRHFSHTDAIRYEMDVEFTGQDVSTLLERENELRGSERIGFKGRGTKGNVIWADRALLRQIVELKIPEEQKILTAKGILSVCGNLKITGGEQ